MNWLQASGVVDCTVVEIFNGLFNMAQVVLLAYLANRAVHKDRIQAESDRDALEKIRKA